MSTKSRRNSLSSTPNGKLFAFESAEIRHSKFNNDSFLYVTGEAAENGWDILLAPRIYHEVPDFVQIELLLIRQYSGSGKSQDTKNINRPYQLSIPLNDICGKKGIELVGKNMSKIFELSF